jgi:hypothetical protein
MKREHGESFPNQRRLIARKLIAAMQVVKDAVRRFDDGEINIEDALRQIAAAIASRWAA